MPHCARCSLPLALLLTVACPGDSGDTESAPSTGAETGAGTTVGPPTSTGDLPTSTSEVGTTAATETTATTAADATDTGPDCSTSRLISRWTLPASTTCFGIGMDDSNAVTVLAGEDDSDDYEAQLHRFVDGAITWSLVHPPPDEFVRPHALALRGDGVAVIAGFASDPTPGSFEYLPWTAAYDATGALLWEHVDNTDACGSPPCRQGQNQGVVVTAGGEFLVAGERGLYVDFDFDMTGVLRRYDAMMGEIDLTEFPTPANDNQDETKAMALRADGGVVLIGETYNEPFSADLWVARLAADGTFESIDTFATGDEETVEFVTALSDGSIVFTAIADDFYAARIDAATSPIWQIQSDWYGPVITGPGDVVYAAIDDNRVLDRLDADGDRQWADDPCLEGYGARALGLSPDGTQVLVCRNDPENTFVEIYDAT